MIHVSGNGPDLVMVHGWGMHSGAWAGVATALAERYTVHRVDLPGHGVDTRDRTWSLGAFAEEVLASTPTADWIGWSLGSQVTLTAAQREPEQVRRMILVGANPRFVAAPDWPDAMPERAFQAFRDACIDDGEGVLERFVGLQVLGAADPEATLRDMRRMLQGAPEPGHKALRAGLEILATTDLREQLPGLAQPTLWISGSADRVSPPAASRAAAGMMSNARFRAIEGAGHAPFVRHEREVTAILDEFLAGGAEIS